MWAKVCVIKTEQPPNHSEKITVRAGAHSCSSVEFTYTNRVRHNENDSWSHPQANGSESLWTAVSPAGYVCQPVSCPLLPSDHTVQVNFTRRIFLTTPNASECQMSYCVIPKQCLCKSDLCDLGLGRTDRCMTLKLNKRDTQAKLI